MSLSKKTTYFRAGPPTHLAQFSTPQDAALPGRFRLALPLRRQFSRFFLLINVFTYCYRRKKEKQVEELMLKRFQGRRRLLLSTNRYLKCNVNKWFPRYFEMQSSQQSSRPVQKWKGIYLLHLFKKQCFCFSLLH